MQKCSEPGTVFENVRFDEAIDVSDTPGVRFINTRHFGSNPDETLITTGPGTILDHIYMQGSEHGQRRGVLVNSADVQILSPTILGIVHTEDSQAIAGWDGTKNLVVDGGHLEASGENIMFGGSDPASEDGIPQDILIKNVTMAKPLTYQDRDNCTVKNIFELKNAKRVTLQDCVLSYSWVDGQTGFGIVVTVRNQDGGAPFCTIEDVKILRNIVRACAGAVQILGRDTSYPSGTMKNVAFEDNSFEIDPTDYPGNGKVFQISEGPQGLSIVRTTVRSRGLNNSFIYFSGVPCEGLVFTDNDVPEGEYGVAGDGTGQGTIALDAFAPGCQWNNVTVHRDPTVGRNINYPPGTTVV